MSWVLWALMTSIDRFKPTLLSPQETIQINPMFPQHQQFMMKIATARVNSLVTGKTHLETMITGAGL